MIIWILFLSVVYSLLGIYKIGDKSLKSETFITILLFVIWFAGFRDGLGMDYEAYSDNCNRERPFFEPIILDEPIYKSFTNFCYHSNYSEVFFFLCCSAITVAIPFIVYRKYANFPIAVFVYITFTGIFVQSFNIVRQFTASSIFFAAFVLLKFVSSDNLRLQSKSQRNQGFQKIILAICLIFVDFCIHKSSLFILPVLLLSNKSINYLTWFILIILSFTIPISGIFNLPLVSDLIFLLNYSDYEYYDNAIVSRFSITNIYVNLITLTTLLAVWYRFKIKSKASTDGNFILSLKMMCLYCLFNNIAANGVDISYRISISFVMFIPLVLSYLPKFINKNIAYLVIIIPLLTSLIIQLSLGSSLIVPDRILPLTSIFD